MTAQECKLKFIAARALQLKTTRNVFAMDYVNLKKPSATRIAIRRAYRKAKPLILEVFIFATLLFVVTADFFE